MKLQRNYFQILRRIMNMFWKEISWEQVLYKAFINDVILFNIKKELEYQAICYMYKLGNKQLVENVLKSSMMSNGQSEYQRHNNNKKHRRHCWREALEDFNLTTIKQSKDQNTTITQKDISLGKMHSMRQILKNRIFNREERRSCNTEPTFG